jgi:hypothetical protein
VYDVAGSEDVRESRYRAELNRREEISKKTGGYLYPTYLVDRNTRQWYWMELLRLGLRLRLGLKGYSLWLELDFIDTISSIMCKMASDFIHDVGRRAGAFMIKMMIPLSWCRMSRRRGYEVVEVPREANRFDECNGH